MAPRRVERTLIAAVGLLFVAWAVAFVHGSSFVCADGVRRYSLFDDAMISMRYAWNLAHGQGLVWNPGERIEGYTNLLMTLFMAVWCSFLDKKAAVLAVQLSGIAFLLATAAFSAKAGARVASPGGAPPRGLNAALFASALAYYPLAYWSLMGMETGLLAMLVSASVLLALRTDAQPRASLPLAATLGLAFLTRPDAAVLIALIFLYRAAGLPRTRAALKPLLIEAAAVGSFVVAVAAFRLVYYGRLTPNTYTLKIAGIPVLDRLANGFAFMEPFLRSTGLLMALLLVLAVLRRDRRRALVVGLLVVATGYSMWAGGDPWPLWRHAAAVMPLVLVLSAIEIHAFVGRIAARVPLRPAGRSALGAAAAVALMALVLVLVNAGFGDEIRLRVPPYEADSNRENVNTALALRDIALPGASVGVTWAGALPYYSGLLAIDYLGRSDSRIAALPPDLSGRVTWSGMRSVPGHNKYDLTYSLQERRPTYTQEYAWGRQDLREWVAQNYVSVFHRGAVLCLLENSPHVDWRKLSRRRARGCTEEVVDSLAGGME